MRIGVDLMGGDNSPHAIFSAVVQAVECLGPNDSITIIATHRVIQEIKGQPLSSKIEFYSVADTIAMGDDPLLSVFRKRGSSIVVGIRLLKKRMLDAFVSAGNSGALIASATIQLPRLPGIKRPALLALLPTVKGSVAILDIGGSVSCRVNHLIQFAYMGAVFQSCHLSIEKPKIALLNIGVEAQKGNSVLRQAYQQLSTEFSAALPVSMQFFGNVEGRDVFQGEVDVVVTDGFTGNVLLKTSEGVSSFIFDQLKELVEQGTSDPFKQNLKQLKRDFSYDEYPGAILCGIEGVIVKCHGNSSSKGILNGIKGAMHLVNQGLIAKMKEQLAILEQSKG